MVAAYAVLAALPTQDVEVDDVAVEGEEAGMYCTIASAYWLVLSAIVAVLL